MLTYEGNYKRNVKGSVVISSRYFGRKGSDEAVKRFKGSSTKHKFDLYKIYAKSRKKEFGVSFEECEFLFLGKCYYCGENSNSGKLNGIDRVDNKIGYLSENVVSCCSRCNFAKGDMLKDDFIGMCVKIASHSNSVTAKP